MSDGKNVFGYRTREDQEEPKKAYKKKRSLPPESDAVGSEKEGDLADYGKLVVVNQTLRSSAGGC